MRLLSSLEGIVSFDSALTELAGYVSIESDFGSDLTVDIDTVSAEAVDPANSSIAAYRPSMHFEVSGLSSENRDFSHEDFVGEVSIEDSLDKGTAWSFDLPASSGKDWDKCRIGYELDYGGPPPGPSNIEFYVRHITSLGGAVDVSLFDKLVSKRSNRVVGKNHVLRITGVGPEGRYNKKRVTYQLGPGHKKTHGTIIRELAIAAGIPSTDIEVGAGLGSPRDRAIDIVNEVWVNAAEEAAAACGMYLGWRNGKLSAFPIINDGPPEFVLSVDNISAQSDIGIDSDAEKPLCVKIKGEQPVIRLDEGLITEIDIIVDIDNQFTLDTAKFQIDSDGTYSTFSGLPTSPQRRIVHVLINRTVKRGDCIVAEYSDEYGYKNIETFRYTQDATGAVVTPDGYNPCYVFSSESSPSDSDKGYLYPTAIFTQLSGSFKFYVYTDLLLTQTREANFGWKIQQASIYNSDGSPRNGAKIVGGGAGAYGKETYLGIVNNPVLITGDGSLPSNVYAADSNSLAINYKVTNNLNDNGYLVSQDGYEYTATREGGSYIYSDGFIGKEYESLAAYSSPALITSRFAIKHIVHGDSYTKISRQTNPITNQVFTTIEKGAGSLPASTRCDPNDDSRKKNRPWCRKVCASGVYATGDDYEIENDFIETEEEGISLATILLKEIHAIEVEIVTPVNALLRKGMPVFVYHPKAGLMHNGWIFSVKHSRGAAPGQPILTTCIIKLHTI